MLIISYASRLEIINMSSLEIININKESESNQTVYVFSPHNTTSNVLYHNVVLVSSLNN